MKNLKQLIGKSRQTPALAPIYAMELDRQLRGMAKAPLTFSAKGFTDEATETARSLGLDKLFDANSTQHAGGTIYQAEMLAKEGKRSEAISYAFANAHGPEVNALNLIYANHSTTNPKLHLHFLNKYLAAYGLQIDLEVDVQKNFFQRIQSKHTYEKVNGPLVTVIMPAHNVEGTIDLAVGSLLNQTWQNLQIIVVDDASTDGTLQKAKHLAKRDPRVEVLASPVNVGPYVCRNLGVTHTRGQWLTVHDADDWAFPDRIEQQVQALTTANALACTGYMLRINTQGLITRPIRRTSIADDGFLRLCYVSLLIETSHFRNVLGAWDSVRVSGDLELIERLRVLRSKTLRLRRPLMLCLDHDEGLTNNHELGLSQPIRADYKNAFSDWHKTSGSKKLTAFGNNRIFKVPKANLVDQVLIEKVFAARNKNLNLIKSSELFDADWYIGKYIEVEQTGMAAAEHYLLHGATGATDPSRGFSSSFYLLSRSLKTNPLIHYLKGKDSDPNPKRVLMAAAEVAKTGAHDQAIGLAEAHLSPELAYTTHILKANAALAKGNEAGWQKHLNAYLAHFKVAPICLDAGKGSVFDRLNTTSLPKITNGPLITVIMPAWNAEKTVLKAARSILDQTYCNLELLIIDDASTDRTWEILRKISKIDSRVTIFRNKINVGPYVSKNIALQKSKGEWVTGLDADDWSFPQRLEHQIQTLKNNKNLKAVIASCIRINPIFGNISSIQVVSDKRSDGVIKLHAITAFFEREFLIDVLGSWDSARFGADSELIGRAKFILGDAFQETNYPCLFYSDTPNSLTNNSETYFNKTMGISPLRAAYRNSWQNWQDKLMTLNNVYCDFPPYSRRYEMPERAAVPLEDVLKLNYI